MKTKIIIPFVMFLTLSFSVYSQTLKFKVSESSNESICKECTFETTPLKNPMNVSFDGKLLKLYYDDGKEWGHYNIISYDKKESKSYDVLEVETFILLTKDKSYGFYMYIIITKDYKTSFSGEILYTIKIPFVYKDGMVTSYTIFQ